MDVRIESSWKQALREEFEKPYFVALSDFVRKAYQQGPVYPPPKQVFAAFEETPLQAVRVVILGQDPYHGPGQAHGLSFSVQQGVRNPPSLQNIYKELLSDLGRSELDSAGSLSGDLHHWAKQGVLLLNATLTVQAGQPGSHQGKGWEQFTDAVIRVVNDTREHVVFILWGAYAQKKGVSIDRAKHLVLSAPHPSPFSAHTGFFGSKPFSATNAYLAQWGERPIHWIP